MYVYVSVLQKYNTKEFTFCLSPVKNPKTTFAIPRYMTAEEGHTDFRFSNNSKSRTKNGLAEEETTNLNISRKHWKMKAINLKEMKEIV